MGKQNARIEFTADELLLMKLDEVIRNSDQQSIRETGRSLLLWYQRKGEWTPRQKYLVEQLSEGHRRTQIVRTAKPRESKKYSLYAVRLGTELKVGMTCRLVSRVNSYRTSCPDVEFMHEIKLGAHGPGYARSQERKLHKLLRQRGHWIIRELFRLSALSDMKTFVPKPPK